MKTFSFSILVLISSAACLQAQGVGGDESNQFAPLDASKSNYYAKPRAVTVRANHVLDKLSSNRSEFAKIPVGNLVPPKVVPSSAARLPATAVRAPVLRTSKPMRNWKQEAALVSMNQPIAPKRSKRALRQDVEIQAPPAAQEIIGEIGRPSPGNSNGFNGSVQDLEIVSEPPLGFSEAGSRRSEGVEIGPTINFNEATTFETLPAVEPPQDETFSRQWEDVEYQMPPQETYSTQWDNTGALAAPLDAANVFERVETWEPKASQMRHVSDYFSPGGEPFAKRTHQHGDPDFFGVDRRASCDEWANFANCGGLKVNPGHLGSPWLKSKDDCEQRTRLRFRRCECQSPGGCNCPSSGP